MKRAIFAAVLALLLGSTLAAPSTVEASAPEKIENAREVLQDIVKIPERGIPPALLGGAAGIAIIPGVIKAGFVVGGEYGKGVLLVREKTGAWSPPVFVSIAGGSVGWQAGVEAIDVILVFKNSRSVQGIMNGTFTIGADASAAAGPVGREAAAATDARLKAEIYSYSRSRGLFAGLAIDGAVLRIDETSDEAYYGKGLAKAGDVVAGKALVVPPEAKRLMDRLAAFAK